MNDKLLQLADQPENWELRRSVVQQLFEEGQKQEAANLLSDAPTIPGDDSTVLFSASVISAVDPESAHEMLKRHVTQHGSSPAIEKLKASLPEPVNPKGSGEEVYVLTASDAEWDEGNSRADYPAQHEEGGRSFLVAEGEAVHAAERGPDTNEKIGALLVAAIVHVVIVLLFMVWSLATPRPEPPQITVSSLPQTDDPNVENQTMSKVQEKTASSVSAVQPVLTSMAFSSFAVPDTFDTADNLSMVAMSNSDSGFGMSISGLGDVSNMTAIPAGMRSRCSMSQRMARLRESGGEDRAERAVRDGIDFLHSKQNEDGSFGKKYTAGMTGLTLLAYLGHCQTPESPKYGDSVVKAALWLMDRSLKNDGLITNGERGHHEAYEHAIGTYALCELYTMTKESGKEIPRLESVLRRSVGVIVDEQSKNGGWPYLRGSKDDMSVSGWNIQALKAAYNTGRKFSRIDRALDLATQKYLPAIQDSEGMFKYNPDHSKGKPTLTGAALLGMQIWKGVGTPAYEKGFQFLFKHYKNASPGANYYAPYYNTQVFFLAEGKEWEEYNRNFAPRLLDAQNSDGSWLQDGGGREDNQILNTAWAVLMLEVYYRYLPTTDKVTGLDAR